MDDQFDIVDFHSHILPIDHGCDSLQTALSQLKLAKSAGVKRIVLTPHFYPHIDDLGAFLEKRSEAYSALVSEISNFDEYPDIILGCELLICEGISNMPDIDELCISGTKTLLLELPFSDFSDRYVDDIETLISRGYNVVLAHADRYNTYNIDKLLSVGARVQINADALCALFLSKAIKNWLSGGYVSAIGSDIHMLNKKYYNRFKRAGKLILKKYPAVILASDEIWNSATKENSELSENNT